VRIGLAGLVTLTLAGLAQAADQEVRWRNITRERLPKDVEAVALEYTVILVKDGQERPIDPVGHQFDIGDRILVRIQPKDDMYIYIFTEGPQGDKSCLLPASEDKPPLVKQGKFIELPDDGFFRFDEPAGEEKLIVVATRQESKDLAALANVVFRKPQELLTDQEKKEQKNRIDQVEKSLQSSNKVKVAGAKRRGILSQDAVDEFNAEVQVKKRGTIEEPPHGKETSTFAMAVADRSAGAPELLIDIPLKSVARPAGQK
jgi:hypothetical protein